MSRRTTVQPIDRAPPPAVSTPPEHEHADRSPAAFMSAAAGATLVAWAATALVRTGVTNSWHTPVVEVAGFTTTAILAMIVLGVGAVLLLAAATRRRAVICFAGLAVTGAAVALALDPSFGESGLAAERDFAIAVAILSSITAAVALVAADVVRMRPTSPPA